jgi:hypothetical protein
VKPEYFYVVALILGLVAELQADAKSLLGWAVVLLALGLLWGFIKL